MQRPRPFFPARPAGCKVPSGEALNEAAEVSPDRAAVPAHASGERWFSAQPAATYEGKQGDECRDHRGDSRHGTCLNHLYTIICSHLCTHYTVADMTDRRGLTTSQRTTFPMSTQAHRGTELAMAAVAQHHSRPVYGYVPLYLF